MSLIWFILVFLVSVTFKGTHLIQAASIAAPDLSTFRKDYSYYSSSNGWLKFHMVPAPFKSARLACHLEGARLASPLNEMMYAQMRALMQHMPRSIHTGISTMSTEDDYFSIEGVHLRDLPHLMWAENEPDNKNNEERCLAMTSQGAMADIKCDSALAFICYKEKSGFMTMNTCGNFDNQYQRNNATGSCYKYYKSPATWHRAHSICTADYGHLAIINSNEEAEILKNLAANAHHEGWVFIGFYNYFAWNSYHLGRYNFWSTMDGKSLEEAGFARWLQGEPNNLGGKEFCGSFRQTKTTPLVLNDQSCESQLPFICEIDA